MYVVGENNTTEDPQRARLPKILNNLQKTKRIYRFEEIKINLYHGVKNLVVYRVWSSEKNDKYTKIVFDDEATEPKLPKKIFKGENVVKYTSIDTQRVLIDKILRILKKGERKIANGEEKEDRFIKAISNEKSKPHSLFAYCYKGSIVSDGRGRDVHVGYRDEKRNKRMVPIQIKSSREHQDRHIEKWPKIPSIVISSRMPYEYIVELATKICDRFIHGYFHHL